MKKVFHAGDIRGRGDHGWLKTRHSFSFANWYEPTRMGFGALRVINDDWIAPHEGFGAHPHRDMEIITIVTSGVLTHEDSMGNRGMIPAGDVQVMSAGSGVVHSEKNEGNEPLTLFQIWIQAKEKNITPRYGQQSMHLEQQEPGLKLLVAPRGTPDVLTINQDAYLYHGVLDSQCSLSYTPRNVENEIYCFVIAGFFTIGDMVLHERDGLGISPASTLSLTSEQSARFLLFEVPSL